MLKQKARNSFTVNLRTNKDVVPTTENSAGSLQLTLLSLNPYDLLYLFSPGMM